MKENDNEEFPLQCANGNLFGKGAIENLNQIAQYGKRVLLVYGKDSIKKMGLYDEVVRILEQLDMDFFELSGVDPNPRIESVRQGSVLCKKHDVDVVLAVGGGSVIDCAKIVAAAALYEGDAWELVLDPKDCRCLARRLCSHAGSDRLGDEWHRGDFQA